jgi:hypothetical protein
VVYQFAGPSGGRVREYNSGKPTVDPGPMVAAWVYGDNSGNLLEYWFYPGASGSSFTGITVDTLNWTGWKLVATSIAPVPTTAQRQFAGFVITQRAGARTGGTVYFDELSVGQGVLSAGQEAGEVPMAWALEQNYPNPFNPTTTIEYAIAGLRNQASGVSQVKLAVYDVLGREVAVLVNQQMRPGSYTAEFNGRGLANGMYVVRLKAGDFTASKKMILSK